MQVRGDAGGDELHQEETPPMEGLSAGSHKLQIGQSCLGDPRHETYVHFAGLVEDALLRARDRVTISLAVT